MNFISHYYHELPVADDYFIAGVVLPDILSNFSKRHGSKVRLNPASFVATDDPAIQAIGEGVRQHYYVDAFFHDSEYFDAMTDMIEAVIHDYPFECFQRRLFAFSHVFLELLMDRVIMQRDITICDNMYRHLEGVDERKIEHFFSAQTATEVPESIASHFSVFVQRRFLYHYLDDARFTGILDAINTSFGNPAFSKQDKMHFVQVIARCSYEISKEKFPSFRTD